MNENKDFIITVDEETAGIIEKLQDEISEMIRSEFTSEDSPIVSKLNKILEQQADILKRLDSIERKIATK